MKVINDYTTEKPSETVSALRVMLAFPVRAFVSLYTSVVITVLGVSATALVLGVVLLALTLCLTAIFAMLAATVLLGPAIGLIRVGDWIAGTKTVVIRDLINRLNKSKEKNT
jgi:uncharacterized membrane protein